MAHQLLTEPIKDSKKKKQFKFNLEGKFGIAFYIASKEIFIGVSLNNVILETVTRSRKIKTTPGSVQVYKWD